jgi:LacI family transcriptional regulator
MAKPKTVFEVAKLANVSIATVSRALNTPDAVREELRQRVIEAANKLGYRSNPAAKALRERRTKIIAIVVPTLDDEAFSRMVNGLQSVFSSNGYAAFVQVAGFDNTKIHDTVRGLFDRGAEALAIVGRIYDRKLLKLLSERRIPTVTMYSRLDDDAIPSIGIDNVRATDKLVDHLLSLGTPPAGHDRRHIARQRPPAIAHRGLQKTDAGVGRRESRHPRNRAPVHLAGRGRRDP